MAGFEALKHSSRPSQLCNLLELGQDVGMKLRQMAHDPGVAEQTRDIRQPHSCAPCANSAETRPSITLAVIEKAQAIARFYLWDTFIKVYAKTRVSSYVAKWPMSLILCGEESHRD